MTQVKQRKGLESELSEELVMQEKRQRDWIMNCDVGVATEGKESELSEELVMQDKRKKGWRTNCDVGEATEGLENEL